jgi:hypothetical protein
VSWFGGIGDRSPRDQLHVTLTLRSGRRVVGEAIAQDDATITILIGGRLPAAFRRDQIERVDIRRTILETAEREQAV